MTINQTIEGLAKRQNFNISSKNMRSIIQLFFVFVLATTGYSQLNSQPAAQLERRVSTLEQAVQSSRDGGLALFLFGAFCALWAQNTGRNPWLWFFLGLFFSVISVLVLLYKNSSDRELRKIYPTPLTDRFGQSREPKA